MFKKILSHIFIFVIIAMIFAPVYVSAQETQECGWFTNWGTCFANALGDIFATILYLILTIVSYILYIAGLLLDYVLRYTIIDLKLNLQQLTGINIAWKVIKDLMNLAFIFILIYKGIELIIGVGSKDSIKNFISALVIAALLVNFSLFFTKVLIDASNIVTLGFYKTIVESAGTPIDVVGPTGVPTLQMSGISVPFMKNLGLSTFWDRGSFDSVRNQTGGNWQMVIIPLMGIFLFLITAFVFTAVAFIFVIRYIVLIILLILSPIAYMGSALPLLGSYSKDWWKALSGQLLFGPIYMVMTWIVLTLMGSAGFITGNSVQWGQLVSGAQVAANVPYQQSPISLVFNFAMLIGLIIASLIVSKKYASQGSTQLAKITGNASNMAGSAVFGGTAWLGRKTMGNAGRLIAEDAGLQERADKGGTFSRLALYGARKARDGSYETRNASIPTSVIGDTIRGTVGRTGFGKAVGLNDVNTGNISLMSGLSDTMGAGKGGTNSVMDERKESKDRVAKRDSANANELAIAQAKVKIEKGSNSTDKQEIADMEKALAKLSEKQTAELVDGNKKLLDSQNFANALSIKQLEALNKSDLLDDGDKARLKNSRFFSINQGMQTMRNNPGSMTPTQTSALNKEIKELASSEIEMLDSTYLSDSNFVNLLKPSQIEAINKSNNFSTTQKEGILGIRFETINTAMGAGGIPPKTPTSPSPAADAVKSLSDAELEMINADYLTKPSFVAQLKSGQIDAITKSNNFTRTQKDALRALRKQPLDTAIAAGSSVDAIKIVQEMSPEEVAALGSPTLNNPILQPSYTVNMLKRMAVKMTTKDIGSLRALLLANGSSVTKETRKWLESESGVENFT